jgi:DNA repair protein RecO (recombination protein O)
LKTIEADALVVRLIPYGESDLVTTFVTAEEGKVAAIVRGGRKSSKRVGGALEPLHTVHVRIDERSGDLGVLREARIVRVREGIAKSLEAMESAGMALRWARELFPARTREDAAWRTLCDLLDKLDDVQSGVDPRVLLASAGMRLLADVGYGLELERCVVCGKPCPEDRSAYVDVARGGLICTSCGRGRLKLPGPSRRAAILAQRGVTTMTVPEAQAVLSLVQDALAAHVDLEP